MFKEHTSISKIEHSALKDFDGEVWIKRDDLIHPEVSGNKWRKLKDHVNAMRESKRDGLLTFGGAYSNHIAATARAGHLLGIPTIGIIRGDELTVTSNTTLKAAAKNGMKLVFVSREEYRLKSDFDYKKQLRIEFGNVQIVPEGGAGYLGMCGCQNIYKEHPNFDSYFLASGTGTTLAGMLVGLQPQQKVFGVSALKGGFLTEEVNKLLGTYFMDPDIHEEYSNQFDILNDYHFGGYAKVSEELIDFIRNFYRETGIQLDPIYTGKMFYGLFDQLRNNKVFSGQKILAVHTGGLQGIAGIEASLGVRIFN